jgi:hypothetical protein
MHKITLRHLRISCTLICGIVVLGYAVLVRAQGPPLENAFIEILPSTPNPSQQVNAQLKSFSFDLQRSTVTWTVNGGIVSRGVGSTRITFQTGPVGTATTLEAKIDDPFGRTFTATKVIRPAHVGLAWETETYTPPLYRGKALFSPGARIKFVALPIIVSANGTRISTEQLIYTWMRDRRELREVSGLGKQTLILDNDTQLRDFNISVEVTTFDGSVKARGSVTVPVRQPQVGFYEFHPLLGMRYAHALSGTVPLSGSEISVVAEPYYYSSQNRNDVNLEYAWTVDGNEVDAQGMVTLRPVGEAGGRSSIQLALRHRAHIMQTTRDTFSVSFTAPPTAEASTF